MKYAIGQKLVLTEDMMTESCLSGQCKVQKQGTELYVTADKDCPKVIYPNGDIAILPKDSEISGFYIEGLASWIYKFLCQELPLEDMLEDNDATASDVKSAITTALCELGFRC